MKPIEKTKVLQPEKNKLYHKGVFPPPEKQQRHCSSKNPSPTRQKSTIASSNGTTDFSLASLIQICSSIPRLDQSRTRSANTLFDIDQTLGRLLPIPLALIPVSDLTNTTQIFLFLCLCLVLFLCSSSRLLESLIFSL